MTAELTSPRNLVTPTQERTAIIAGSELMRTWMFEDGDFGGAEHYGDRTAVQSFLTEVACMFELDNAGYWEAEA